jgi:drug/metabolite transporter (DMT)-like permease
MSLHTTTGRWRLGLALSLVAALMWGVLPIILDVLLDSLDPYTITWCRFSIACALTGAFVLRKHGLPRSLRLQGSARWMLPAAMVALTANYVLFAVSLEYLSPSTSAVVIQLAPIFMLLGGLALFRERFTALQWTGFGILLVGLGAFFNDRLGELLSSLTGYTVGVLLVVAASVMWAVYALAQKQLLRTFPSETVVALVCLAGAVLLLPMAHPGDLIRLDGLALGFVVFLGLNTVVAYGCFAEALDHWQASSVGAVLATVPIMTVVGMKLCALWFPAQVASEGLNAFSVAGAVLVAGGSALCALGQPNGKNEKGD